MASFIFGAVFRLYAANHPYTVVVGTCAGSPPAKLKVKPFRTQSKLLETFTLFFAPKT